MSPLAAGSQARPASARTAARPAHLPGRRTPDRREQQPRYWCSRPDAFRLLRRFPPPATTVFVAACAQPTAGPWPCGRTTARLGSSIWSMGSGEPADGPRGGLVGPVQPRRDHLATGGGDGREALGRRLRAAPRDLPGPRGPGGGYGSATTAERSTPRAARASSPGIWRAPAGSGGPTASSPDPSHPALSAVIQAPLPSARTAPCLPPPWPWRRQGRTARPALPATGSSASAPGIGRISAMAFSPDGNRLAVTGDAAPAPVLMDVSSGRVEERMTGGGHRGEVFSMVFAPNGTRLVTGGNEDGLAIVWDTQTGRSIRRLQDPPPTNSKRSRSGSRSAGARTAAPWPRGADGQDPPLANHRLAAARGVASRYQLHLVPGVLPRRLPACRGRRRRPTGHDLGCRQPQAGGPAATSQLRRLRGVRPCW